MSEDKTTALEEALMEEFDAELTDVREWIGDEVRIEHKDVISAMEAAVEKGKAEGLKEEQARILKILRNCKIECHNHYSS